MHKDGACSHRVDVKTDVDWFNMKCLLTKKEIREIIKEEYDRAHESEQHVIFPKIRSLINAALHDIGLNGLESFAGLQNPLDMVYSLLDDYGYVMGSSQDGYPVDYQHLASKDGNIKFDLSFRRPDRYKMSPAQNQLMFRWHSDEDDPENKFFVSCHLL